jgi:hypothetical protein
MVGDNSRSVQARITVCVSSENVRPSASLPIRRIDTDLNKRPLRRIFFDIIPAIWGRGQEINMLRILENLRRGGDFAWLLRRKNKVLRTETLFPSGTSPPGLSVASRFRPGIPANAREEVRDAPRAFPSTAAIAQTWPRSTIR